MGDRETMMDMYTRFTHITNELKSLGKSFTTEELVRKILRFLPQSWEAKVTAIQEAKDMNKISLDELIGNIQTYELRRNSQLKEETKRDRGLALRLWKKMIQTLMKRLWLCSPKSSRSFSRRPKRTLKRRL